VNSLVDASWPTLLTLLDVFVSMTVVGAAVIVANAARLARFHRKFCRNPRQERRVWRGACEVAGAAIVCACFVRHPRTVLVLTVAAALAILAYWRYYLASLARRAQEVRTWRTIFRDTSDRQAARVAVAARAADRQMARWWSVYSATRDYAAASQAAPRAASHLSNVEFWASRSRRHRRQRRD
jgi:hypothetical protein